MQTPQRPTIAEENAMVQEVHKIGHNSGLKRKKANLLSSTDKLTTSRLLNGQKHPSYQSFVY
jgi:Tfp pilus assembly protein PilO